MKETMMLIAAAFLAGCVFQRPAQVLVWRSNSSLMATEGKTASITKGDEGNAVNADKTTSNESRATVSGTGTATDSSVDNSTTTQQAKKPEEEKK